MPVFADDAVTEVTASVALDAVAFSYRIGAGDLVKIEVFPDEKFTRELRVENTGYIQLPLVGAVPIAGLTIDEASEHLRGILAEGFYRDPRVLVTVIEYRNSQVSVLGAVRHPSVVTLYGTTNILKVLGEAGGFDTKASGRLILVRGGEAKRSSDVVIVDGRALLERGDMTQNIMLYPGDTLFAPRSEQVYVFGQVKNPGAYAYTAGVTLLRAVTLAGGFTDVARDGAVEVLHRGLGSAEKRKRYDIDDIIRNKVEDPVLTPDDVVIVPESFF